MTDLHPWVTTKLQPPIESSVLFRLPDQSNEVIRLDKEGFHYRGQFIEDAGEAHRLMVEFLRQGTVHAKAAQPVSECLQEVHPFVVRHYTNDERLSIKGNGFDGLEIGEDRQEAEEFIAWINKRICRTPEAQP
jgi:hypothetical protein